MNESLLNVSEPSNMIVVARERRETYLKHFCRPTASQNHWNQVKIIKKYKKKHGFDLISPSELTYSGRHAYCGTATYHDLVLVDNRWSTQIDVIDPGGPQFYP